MKKYLFLLIGILVLAACSSPKYTYNFDYYDYNSGKKKPTSSDAMVVQQENPSSALAIDNKTLIASANENEIYVAAKPAPVITKKEVEAKIKSMTKEERKELKNEVKKYVKASKKGETVKAEKAATSLRGDIKLAAIFGAIGIVLLIIGGDVLYVLGAVALLIGLYFFVRYLMRS